jgi:hypothetical protein
MQDTTLLAFSTCYYDTLRELPLVRDGTTRLLDAFHLGPILTFPS